MKIVLINPPQVYAKTWIAAGVTPSMGLLYLAASLQKSGHEPIIIDAVVESSDNTFKVNDGIAGRGLNFTDIIARIPRDVALIGITNLFSFAFPLVRKLTKEIKKVYPAIPVVVGGAHPSATPIETVSEPSIDFVVISEGDKTIVELADNMKNHNAIGKIDGLAYKDEKGMPLLNPKTLFIEDLDSLPFPARELVPFGKYYEIGKAHGPSQSRWTPILSSRGCPYQCTFCTPKLWDRRYRVRTAENVLAEIEECIEKYGIKEFHFEDENFTVNKKRTIAICRGIIEKRLKIRWQTPNGIRASVTDEAMLDIMQEAGCHHITFAPESGSERVLNEIIRKQQDLPKVTALVRHASKIGLRTAAYFVSGLPGETVADVEKSIGYACELARIGLDEIAFSRFVPLPGSELYDKLVSEGRFNTDWKVLISTGDLSEGKSWSEHISSRTLQQLRRKAYFRFYLTRLIYHPFKVIRSIINIIRRKEELKTERIFINLFRR
jgi:magnesium-protoporphyrin IX monomethyl ester (oxidative) cyclase